MPFSLPLALYFEHSQQEVIEVQFEECSVEALKAHGSILGFNKQFFPQNCFYFPFLFQKGLPMEKKNVWSFWSGLGDGEAAWITFKEISKGKAKDRKFIFCEAHSCILIQSFCFNSGCHIRTLFGKQPAGSQDEWLRCFWACNIELR